MSGERVPAADLIHRGIGHVEFFDLTASRLRNLQSLIDMCAGEGRHSFSFHAPISRPPDFPYSGVTCFFLSEEENKREKSFHLLERSLKEARHWNAAYVVTHLTYSLTDTKNATTALRLAIDACHRMDRMSEEAGIPIDIEFAPYTDTLHHPEDFVELIEDCPHLGLCIDIGHARVGAEIRERNFFKDIETLSARVRSAHLWNSKGAEHSKRHGHVPLHPDQKPENGWIDVETALSIILGDNPSATIVFEYPVERVTQEIQEGYEWIASLVGGKG